MVIIEEEEDDVEAANHFTMDSSSSLSSHHHHHSHQPSSSSSPTAPPPAAHPSADSPDTVSSISSDHTFHGFSPSTSPPINPAGTPPPSILLPVPAVANRLVRDHPGSVTKTESEAETWFSVGGDRDGGFGGRRVGQPLGVLRRARMEKMMKRVGLGLRACEFVVCLVSLSVMAADKNLGWALDSFHRYVEFSEMYIHHGDSTNYTLPTLN